LESRKLDSGLAQVVYNHIPCSPTFLREQSAQRHVQTPHNSSLIRREKLARRDEQPTIRLQNQCEPEISQMHGTATDTQKPYILACTHQYKMSNLHDHIDHYGVNVRGNNAQTQYYVWALLNCRHFKVAS
jgi:hypothetical protein